MEELWKDFDFDEDDDSASFGLAAAARLEGAKVAAYVMADDADALHCGVCWHPLKPPIFQCGVGHVVCAPCRDKLKDTGKCHVCGTATGGDYRRCHAMERLVESIRFPCPYAVHGCTAMPAYCHKQSHRQSCPHAPFHCPDKNCGFVGSLEALADHFAGEHGWPCTTRTKPGHTCRCSIRLSDGFNFLFAELASDGEGGAAAGTSGKYLFLLNVARQEVGCAISVLLVGRKPSAKVVKCVLTYSRRVYDDSEHQKFLGSHLLQSEINVECWDLSTGLPGPKDCFQFVVPDFVLGEDKENAIQVKISISVVNSE